MIDAVIGDIVSAMPADERDDRRRARTSTACARRAPRNISEPDRDEHHAGRDDAVARRTASLSRGVSGATMIMIGAIGRRRSAAPSGL